MVFLIICYFAALPVMEEKIRKIYTVGHSIRSVSEFLEILSLNRAKILVDIRRFPGSRRSRLYNKENLEKLCLDARVSYIGMGRELGGFRSEGYRNYMKTIGFEEGLNKLTALATDDITIMMCAEALFNRCHRRFISDELVKRGWQVYHILEGNKTITHPFQEEMDFESIARNSEL